MAPEAAPAAVRDVFAREWLACTLRTYPEHFGGLFREAASPFRNPVGSTLRAALTGLTEELFGGFDRARVTALVDVVVRLRAVQDFTPPQVTEFVTLARRAAARVASTGTPRPGAETLELVSARIDALTPIADERLARCRDDLRAITERAARRRVFVLERMHARAAAGPPASRGETP
jgi:hypothetical protein